MDLFTRQGKSNKDTWTQMDGLKTQGNIPLIPLLKCREN